MIELETSPVLLAFAFAVGACVGSFLNVCVGRWPRDESVVRPRSRCPKCGKAIRARDNIPIFGWLLLRGRCRDCSEPISPQYPIVELVVALGWLATVAMFGAGFTALRVALFGTVMLGIALSDAEHYLIPDQFTVVPFFWIIATSLVAAWIGDTSPFAAPWDAIVGACAGAGAIAIVGWLGEYFLRKEAMGFGDVTLMALVGAALGPGRSLLTIFIGAFIGAASFLLVVYPVMRIRAARRPRVASATIGVGDATDLRSETDGMYEDVELPHVPFGVFLAPAALVTLLWGERLIEWYLRRMTI